jgi:hypothetical protein
MSSPRRGGWITYQRAIGLLVTAALVTGCMVEPRHQQRISRTPEPVHFEGYLTASGGRVTIQVLDTTTGGFTSSYGVPPITATSSATAVPDDRMGNWYPWSTNAVLPQDPKFWARHPSEEWIQVRAEWLGKRLGTFDWGEETDGCIARQVNDSRSFSEIFAACRSTASPIVTLKALCGAAGDWCCLSASRCDFGRSCSATGRCSDSCGGLRGRPCEGGICGPGLTPSGGACVECGRSGQPCCPAAGCGDGLACGSGGRCTEECGPYGALCESASPVNTICCSPHECLTSSAPHSNPKQCCAWRDAVGDCCRTTCSVRNSSGQLRCCIE